MILIDLFFLLVALAWLGLGCFFLISSALKLFSLKESNERIMYALFGLIFIAPSLIIFATS